MKLWRYIILLIVAGSVCVAAAGARASAQQKAISEKLIRLHVIANSDSNADQKLKLQVRDAVLEYLEGQRWRDRDEAQMWLHKNLPLLESTCAAKLKSLGCNHSVTAVLENEIYPTRTYDTFSLPAGEYLSLKIVLGEGEGKNWWCVVYPAICVPSTAELTEVAAAAGFSDGEVAFITEDNAGIEVRFKILELLNFMKKK